MKDVLKWNVVYWLGVAPVSFVFSFSKICSQFLGWAKVWVQIWDFRKIFVCNDLGKQVINFYIQIIWADFGAFWFIKTTQIIAKIDYMCIYLFVFWSLCFSHCVSVAAVWSPLKSPRAPWRCSFAFLNESVQLTLTCILRQVFEFHCLVILHSDWYKWALLQGSKRPTNFCVMNVICNISFVETRKS